MAKITAKPASAPKAAAAPDASVPRKPMAKAPAAAPKATILYGELDEAVLSQQSPIFERAGYTVQRTIGRAGVLQAIPGGQFDVIVLGHTLTKDDRHHIPYIAKKADPEVRILVIHASGKHHAVDRAVDTRMGFDEALDALAELVAERHLAAASA